MKNIEINIKQTDGTYEVLYPKVNAVSSNVSTEVSQQFGLENGSIDDVLKYLGKFNEYWWSEEFNTESWEWSLLYYDYVDSKNYIPSPVYYSQKINIADDGSISLISEQSTYNLNTFKGSLPCYVRMRIKYGGASDYTQEYFWVTEETAVGFYTGTYGDDNDPYIDYKGKSPVIQHIKPYKKQLPTTVTWKTNINSEAYSKNFYKITYNPDETSVSSVSFDYDRYYGCTSSYTFTEYGKAVPGEFEKTFSPYNSSDYVDEVRAFLPGKYVFRLKASDNWVWDGDSNFYHFDGEAFSISNSKNNRRWTISGVSSTDDSTENQVFTSPSVSTKKIKSGNLNLYWGSPYLNLKQMVHSYIGSYIGTGTYGYDNPTVLEFDFVPKLIICNTLYWSTNGWQNSFIWTINNGIMARASGANGSVAVFHNGTKISLISLNDATAQYNALNNTYNYIVFG